MANGVAAIQSAALVQFDVLLQAYSGFIGIALGVVLFSVFARMVMGWLR
ncbi:hypothetical protein CCP3SC15_1240011 [Gammaproteobacteria bacterium]